MKILKEVIEQFKEADKTAIVDRKEYRKFSYTYNELYQLCLKFVSFLRKKNIKKGDRILIWSYNGIEYAVTLLSCFLSGIILVPIDLKSDINFVKKIQKQVNAKLILQTKYKEKTGIKSVFVEELLDILGGEKPDKNKIKINPDDIAEIIYTSGTTGEPKGVILTNKNLIANINSVNQIEKINESSKFLSMLPLSHMFEQMAGFLIPLSNKSSIVYIKTLKLQTLLETFQEDKITHAILVPRVLEMMRSGILKKAEDEGKKKEFERALKLGKNIPILRKFLFSKIYEKFPSLEYFACGGATLDSELENFYSNIGIPVIQGYGLTETSPILTTNSIVEKKIGSLGKVIPEVKIKIDKNGEILAKGDSITKGYYKNPEKTKELFKDGWMKTGDLGYFDKEGFLFLKGREKDLIVTSAGVNVYPEDIENVLNKIPGVKDSCVIGIGREEEVYAVLLLKGKLNAEKIINEANKKLDISQKIKNFSVWPYEDFPRTTTLKIKKFIVKEFIEKRKKIIVPPKKKSKIHELLAKFTSKKISEDSTLQSLGLSSIDRIELVSSLEQEFSIEIDEEKVVPQTRVKNLSFMVKEGKSIEARSIFQKWTLFFPARIIRFVMQNFVWFPFVWLFSQPSVKGRENLKDITGPVIFASNHQSNFDAPLILMNLPLLSREKTAIAAWQEYFFKPNLEFKNLKSIIFFYLLTLFFNIYPLSQKKGFLKSIKYTGKLIDTGQNILVFPEGRRTLTGKMFPFRQGMGFLAVEMKIPVVPIKIENIFKVLPRGKILPRFSPTKIKIGKPIFIKTDSYVEATKIIGAAVGRL